MALDRREIERLIRAAAPEIGDSFVAVMIRVPSEVELEALTSAIRNRDPNGAWVEIDMAPGDFNDFRETERAAFRTGGEAQASAEGWKINLFDERALADENRRTGRLITEVIDETRDMVRDRVRRAITTGENPRSAALDIIGRRKIGTHTRTGGMIGLTRHQDEYAQRALAELRSADSAQLRNYLERQARDRRFDRTVLRAIRDRRAVPAELRDKMIASYRSRLLRMRGEAVGRTEALGAVNAGQHEAVEQAVRDPDNPVEAQDVRRIWNATSDSRVRDTHLAMNYQTRRQGEPFQSPSGAQLMYPGDRSLGAPAAEVINCRCNERSRFAELVR